MRITETIPGTPAHRPVVALILALLATPVMAQCHPVKLHASTGAMNHEFGFAVAVGASRAIVTSPFADSSLNDTGKAYVLDSATWTEMFEIAPPGLHDLANFGTAAAVSGNLGLVGAPYDQHTNGAISGRAYLYDLTTGMQLHTLEPLAQPLGTYALFGRSVALDSPGAIVGAPYATTVAGQTGMVFVYDTISGNQVMGLLVSGLVANDLFGYAVAADGYTGVFGAPGDDDLATSSGTAFVVDLVTGAELRKIVPADGGFQHAFGSAIAVESNRAAILSPGDGNGQGSIYVYEVSTGNLLVKLVPSQSLNYFETIAIEGDLVLAGGAGDVVHVFSIGLGREVFTVTPSDLATGIQYGCSVSLEAGRLLVGAGADQDVASFAGAAYGMDMHTFWGTAEDLVIYTFVNGGSNFGALCKDVASGDQLTILLWSPNDTFNWTYPVILAQVFAPPVVPVSPYPGIAIDPSLPVPPAVLFDGAVAGSPFGTLLLPPGGIAIGGLIPPALSGYHVLLQGLSITGTAANLIFAAAHAHDLNVL